MDVEAESMDARTVPLKTVNLLLQANRAPGKGMSQEKETNLKCIHIQDVKAVGQNTNRKIVAIGVI